MPQYPIVDNFLYFNEIELLELRYHVLRDHVDRFVISESNQTFSGKPKPYQARADLDRLGLPLDRFIILKTDVTDSTSVINDIDRSHATDVGEPTKAEVWTRQRLQRDAIKQIISEFSKDTVFLLGDVDEIPRPNALQFVAEMLQQNPDYVLKLPLVLLEGRADRQLVDQQQKIVWWDRSLLMCRWQQLANTTPTEMRSEKMHHWRPGHAVHDNRRADDLGWHFTWMGDAGRRKIKAQSCAHSVNLNCADNISSRTAQELSVSLQVPVKSIKNYQQRAYDTKALPAELWQLPRVRDYLLPSVSPSKHFAAQALEAGGKLAPLIVPATLTNGTGLFNPTVLVMHDKIMVNIRHCQYTLFHAELKKFEHEWGPLLYLHPENDCTLTTTNYFGIINHDLEMVSVDAVDTSKLDVKPLWEFVGLEDVRMVQWNDRLFYCGVRRDTTTNGEGRMELSEIDISKTIPCEISRQRMPAPGTNRSYCEKNWMPVVDLPYTFVKWCNPTEVVKYDPDTQQTHQIHLGEWVAKPYDFRGGSQVIPWGDYRIAITHVAYLTKSESGRKDGTYRHVMIVWDQNWNVVKYGEPWCFMGASIEFCCGMSVWQDQVLITFGVQDNAAYILRVSKSFIDRWINE